MKISPLAFRQRTQFSRCFLPSKVFALCFCALSWLMLLCPTPAFAQSKDECVAAYESGQRLRIEGKLLAARESLLICAQPACPSVVTGDCGQWLGEIDKTIPSIVVGVRTPDGKDLLDVSVSIDGQIVRQVIDGKPIPLDPGPHTLQAEAEGFFSYEETLVAQQGDKHRIVAITLKPLVSEEPEPEPVADEPKKRLRTPKARPDDSVPTITYVLGGVSLVAFASTAYFGVSGLNDASDMARPVDEGGCKPNCAQEDVDRARTKIVVANVAFGVGVASAAGALWTYFASRPSKEGNAADLQRARRVSKQPRKVVVTNVGVVPAKNGGMLGISGIF